MSGRLGSSSRTKEHHDEGFPLFINLKLEGTCVLAVPVTVVTVNGRAVRLSRGAVFARWYVAAERETSRTG